MMKGKVPWKLAGGIVVVLLLVFLVVGSGGIGGFTGQIADGAGAVGGAVAGVTTQTPSAPTSLVGQCHETSATTVNYTIRNGQDTTSADIYQVTASVFELDANGNRQKVNEFSTDTTVSLDCGKTFWVGLQRNNAYRGDNSKVVSLDTDSDGQASLLDGGVRFSTVDANYQIQAVSSRHGVIEARAWDIENAAFLRERSNNVTTYQLDGTTFASSTTNDSATTLDTDGEFHIRLDYRANETASDAADFGYFILVEASTTVWNEPSLVLNGVPLVDTKGSLNTDEAAAWSGYEYVYFVDKPITRTINALDFDITALSGVNPGASDDIEIDFAARGQFESINGIDLKVAGVDDTSSKAAVYTLQDFTFDIA